MNENSTPPRPAKPFSTAQTVGWYVMTTIGIGGAYWVITKEHNIREPVVGVVFLCVTVAIAYFTRKFVRDNSDVNGRLRLRRKPERQTPFKP